MTSNREPSEKWPLPSGQAWVFTAGESLLMPVILVADAQAGQPDMAALVAGLDDAAYSFLLALRSARRDLIVVGYADEGQIRSSAKTVTDCVMRAIAEKVSDSPLAVGGLGRGALAARYGLAMLERQRLDHQTATYFSYDGVAPSTDEATELARMGGWPYRPMKLKAVSGGFTDQLNDDDFDDTNVGGPGSGGASITKELGSWIIDRLR